MAYDACKCTYNRPFIFDHSDLFLVTPDTLIIENSNSTRLENSTTPLYNTIFFHIEEKSYTVNHQQNALKPAGVFKRWRHFHWKRIPQC